MGIALDFTGTYKNRRLFGIEDFEALDFSDIGGSKGYCSEEAAAIIRQRISSIPSDTVRYIDDGNYHYMSYFFMERIKEPFELVLFDHHTDMQAPGLIPLLSCGSWVRDAIIDDPDLKHVYSFGPVSPADDELSDKVTFISEADMKKGLYRLEGKLPLYISVDLDILCEAEVKTVWDQGDTDLVTLEKCISDICSSHRVIGIDICG